MDKTIYFKRVIIFILSALLTTCSLEGNIQTLRKKFVENPGQSTSAPDIPGKPVIIAGENKLTVTWDKSDRATSYEVYINTSETRPSAPAITTNNVSAVINNLENNIIYYIWIRAVNSAGKSGYSPVASGTPFIPVTAPQTPSTPIVTIGNEQITVSWTAVEGATAYEVWLGTSNNSASAAKNGNDENASLSRTISGLTNGTTYYIWLKAKNSAGTSGFSSMASGTPIGNMGTVTVVSGNGQLALSWDAVAGAEQYEVYYSTANTIPSTPAQTVSTTTATITELTNGTIYYVWIKPKNTKGTGGTSAVVIGRPLSTSVTHGLYRGTEKIGDQNLSAALSYIFSNAVSGDDFKIVLGADESASPRTLNYPGKTVRITLLGYGGERTITLASNGSMFTINTGVTLTLDENISLVGRSSNNASLVSLNSGNLVINTGAKISGNTSNGRSGGISVNGGTFTMNGGTISGNTAQNGGGGIGVSNNGTVVMNGGTISGNKDTGGYGGGGIFVEGSGTFTMYNGIINGNTAARFGGGVHCYGGSPIFTMHGGIISGNTAGESGGGVDISNGGIFKKLPSGGGQNSGIIYGSEETGVDANGVPLKNTANNNYGGHAVYSSNGRRNTTAGQTDHIDSTTGRGLSTSGDAPYGE